MSHTKRAHKYHAFSVSSQTHSLFEDGFPKKPEAWYDLLLPLMSQSIPAGYISLPGNPRENFFERANLGHPGNYFCLIPLPLGKNDGRIPGGGENFFQTRRNCSLRTFIVDKS